jgi:PBP1b-binding outer membrane lipoprotein LpoB
MAARRGLEPGFMVAACLLALGLAACAPVVSRGGPGTLNPGLDEAPLSTKLDKKDLDYLVEQNLSALYASSFWTGEVAGQGRPFVTIFPIRNDTSQHVDDEMATLLSSIETSLVNSGAVNVVSRERQSAMLAEIDYQRSAGMDPATAARVGRQLNAKYYITGKLGAVDERLKRTRRVQYSLFIQVIDVETSLIKFQYESIRSKAVKG